MLTLGMIYSLIAGNVFAILVNTSALSMSIVEAMLLVVIYF